MAINLLPSADRAERIEKLERLLKSREGKLGYQQNVADLRAEIERLRSA